MSIVTFWNDTREQVGKTLSAVAVATQMSIQYNMKILLISTSYTDSTMKNCYWADNPNKRLPLLEKNNIAVESGIEGLSKLIKSNKIQPNIITDYTKVIFKGRLEVLAGYNDTDNDRLEEYSNKYKEMAECFPELIQLANNYYDMVLVDLDNRLNAIIKQQILSMSNLNVFVITQRLASVNYYKNARGKRKELLSPKHITVINRYIKKTKFNLKNVTRYLGTRENLSIIPYNTLFFEAAEEAGVPDLFLRLRKITDTNDDNYFFISETLKLTNKILNTLKELQRGERGDNNK